MIKDLKVNDSVIIASPDSASVHEAKIKSIHTINNITTIKVYSKEPIKYLDCKTFVGWYSSDIASGKNFILMASKWDLIMLENIDRNLNNLKNATKVVRALNTLKQFI